MKQLIYIAAIVVIALSGCKKDEEKAPVSGTHTINNLRYQEKSTYALHGFTFSTGQEVSTESTPGPDIIIDTLNGTTLIFQANNLLPSFSKAGEYPNETAAKEAFNNLKSVTASQWIDFSSAVLPNQIWIYRSGAKNYTKIRTISTLIEKRQNLGKTINYGECTFEWVHQPDGSLIFP
ncbi:MAG TPA: hypothetical protein VK207_06775 [Bacteroidales bacterium]|jgi:hypothetical protein|nr:hypothetical protein [Bacteroidales bacterium]